MQLLDSSLLCCGFAAVPLLSQAVTSGLEKGLVKPGVCNPEMVDGKRIRACCVAFCWWIVEKTINGKLKELHFLT